MLNTCVSASMTLSDARSVKITHLGEASNFLLEPNLRLKLSSSGEPGTGQQPHTISPTVADAALYKHNPVGYSNRAP